MDKILEKYNNIIQSVLLIKNPLLTEERHLMPNIRTYFDIIWNKVKQDTGIVNFNYIRNEQTYNISIDNTAFEGIDTFFKKAKININLTVTDNFEDFDYTGGYNPQNRVLNTENGQQVLLSNDNKLFLLSIDVNIRCYIGKLQQAIASVVYHEFTHAYEDWMRIKKSNGKDSMRFYIVNSNYNNINAIRQWNKPYGEFLGVILYLIGKIEARAYASGAIGEIETLMNQGNNDFSDCVKKTTFYKNYNVLMTYIGYLNSIQDINIQNGMLNLFNTYSGIIKNSKENKKYTFKSYQSMKTWLQQKAKFKYNQIVDTLSKYFESNLIKSSFKI